MHDWINVDTFNRLTHFKQLFKMCFQFDHQSRQFVENEVYSSDIFKLLPIKLQKELENFADKVLQPPFEELSESTILAEFTPWSFIKKDKLLQPVVELVSLPKTVVHFVTKKEKQLFVCINKRYGSVQFYDSQYHCWHSSPVSLYLPNEQHYFSLALLGNMLYAFGGMERNYNVINKMWSRDLSDPSSQWTARANMKQNGRRFASVVFNDTIYALGGVDNNKHFFRSCERYCSQLNKWSTVADMNSVRVDASAAVINGCIYVAGGGGGKSVLRSVERYKPETDTWREVAPMTTQRHLFTLTSFAGRLWAIGGLDGDSQPLSSCESYDPVTDTWREEALMKEGRCFHAAIKFNEELYVIGGWSFGGKTKLMIKSILTNKHLIKLIYILC